MYRGQRDDHFPPIRVPQINCDKYFSSTSGNWVEIKTWQSPDGSTWESFMVIPDQVRFDHLNPNEFNLIENLNRDSQIKLSQKTLANNQEGRILVPGSEHIVDPATILFLFKDYN